MLFMLFLSPAGFTLGLHLMLLYCEFQKYEFMTTSIVGGQKKEKKNLNASYKATKHIKRTLAV